MTDVAIPDTDTFRRFLAAADDDQLGMSAEQVSIDIIARILDARTVDDVLGGAGVTSASDYLDTPFHLTGVHFNRSGFDSAGPAFYAILEGADLDGVPVTVSCGAKNVIAQAWKLQDMGALPVAVQLRQSSKPTSAGFYVMWLEAAPKGF